MEEIIIIGAGAAGICAALELAKNGIRSVLVAGMPSERAQSVMAEGGINAAFLSDSDSPELHAKETLRAGRFLADPAAVRDLTENAPKIIEELYADGMLFTLNSEGEPDVRAFGGQSVRRTYYAASNTGRQLMHTLIAQVRRQEAAGLVRRLTGWLFLRLLWKNDQVCGCLLTHAITGEKMALHGKVIIASGGLNGMFGNATGSVQNTGAVTASLFADGLAIANGEFIQYHPTTVCLRGKNMLITEAVRGEGGRLFTLRDGRPYYFMEEKYPELGNLMPRDVISREEWALIRQGQQIFLDMRHLDQTLRQTRLKGVMEDCRQFLSLDPAKEPIPVLPGIHYFMGGIRVDRQHRTAYAGLYAAGECACQYHGANRLGGNSLLGAIYGGKTAAKSVMEDGIAVPDGAEPRQEKAAAKTRDGSYAAGNRAVDGYAACNRTACSYADGIRELRRILQKVLGIVRDGETIGEALAELGDLYEKVSDSFDPTASDWENESLKNCCLLGQAMLMSADARKESRGAHTRSDFPEERSEYRKQTIAQLVNGQIKISFESAGEENAY